MSQTHEHDARAPSKQPGGISEFEVGELAVRELAIPKGLFCHEGHRRLGVGRDDRPVPRLQGGG
jgi:hypothetical protein